MKIKYLLPSVYERFFPRDFWNSEIHEIKANCGQCIQAPHKYDSKLKCCTFWPFIPNYIAGQILLSKELKYLGVQTVIEKHIQQRCYTLPMGLMVPPEYQVEYKKKKPQIFGQDDSFLCPYYSKETNNCGAWIFRGSVCTSFYCESSYGKKGIAFWHKFEDYLSYLEMGISQEVLAYKDYSPRDVNDQLEFLNVEKKIELKPSDYKKMWKHNYGNEKKFYIEAAQFVEQLPKGQVKEILGQTGLEAQKRMNTLFQKI